MQVSVRMAGAELARARLAEIGRTVEPVMRGALNTTATQTRTQQYVQPLRGTIKGAKARDGMKIKRANSKRLNARIIPSSAGIPVLEYQAWGYDLVDSTGTRARIWVRGPRGKKIAAGFVNPKGSRRLPLSTRSERSGMTKKRGATTYRYEHQLRAAIGPSLAHWFKDLTTAQTLRWTNAFLQREFEKRLNQEIAKFG